MFDALASWENLHRAYREAARGKRGGAAVAAYEHRLEDQLVALRAALLEGRYRPGRYRSFTIHEPKRRLISAAPFRDRVVHHALCALIEPLFERGFIPFSYANRRFKGTHRALDRCQALVRKHAYVLQCDVQRFFPSMDHSILRAALARKIEDPRVMDLVDLILASGADVHHDGDLTPAPDPFNTPELPRGLPIGNLTSQFWANVYLNGVDHFIMRQLRCTGYLRYVDDLLLFADDKATLWRWREQLDERLAGLRLLLHPHAHPRPTTEGVPFLGFVIYADRRRLKARKGRNFARRYRRLLQDFRAGRISLDQVTASAKGWANHCRYGNTTGLRKAILSQEPIGKPVARPP